jgi:hypothetical protein
MKEVRRPEDCRKKEASACVVVQIMPSCCILPLLEFFKAERKEKKEEKPIALVVQCVVVYVLPGSMEKLKLESSCRMQACFIGE